MCICMWLAFRRAFSRMSHRLLLLYQWFCLRILIPRWVAATLGLCLLRCVLICPLSFPSNTFRTFLASSVFRSVVVHGFERFANATEEDHEFPLGKGGAIDEICIDDVLEIAMPIIWQKDVDCLCAGVAAGIRDNGMIEGADDVWVRCEKSIGFDLFKCVSYTFFAEWAADLFER